MVDQTDQGEENGLTGRRFDDGGFAHTGSVEIDVGAFFGSLCCDIEIENLDNVADEVRELAMSWSAL